MTLEQHIKLMASYNEWMNGKIYAAAGNLMPEELQIDRRAFFKSILGILNHLVAADTIWLKRFSLQFIGHTSLDPVRVLTMPTSLDQILFTEFPALADRRALLDKCINEFATALSNNDLDQVLRYNNTKGVAMQKAFSSVLFHFFNHQTHHRGQITTLLNQAGQDVRVTDLLALIPDEPSLA